MQTYLKSMHDLLLLSLCKCSIYLAVTFVFYLSENLEEVGSRKDAEVNPTLESNALLRASLLESPDTAERTIRLHNKHRDLWK